VRDQRWGLSIADSGVCALRHVDPNPSSHDSTRLIQFKFETETYQRKNDAYSDCLTKAGYHTIPTEELRSRRDLVQANCTQTNGQLCFTE